MNATRHSTSTRTHTKRRKRNKQEKRTKQGKKRRNQSNSVKVCANVIHTHSHPWPAPFECILQGSMDARKAWVDWMDGRADCDRTMMINYWLIMCVSCVLIVSSSSSRIDSFRTFVSHRIASLNPIPSPSATLDSTRLEVPSPYESTPHLNDVQWSSFT